LKAIRILAGRRVTRLAVDQSVGAAIEIVGAVGLTCGENIFNG